MKMLAYVLAVVCAIVAVMYSGRVIAGIHAGLQ
jgi:hypothetical protein